MNNIKHRTFFVRCLFPTTQVTASEKVLLVLIGIATCIASLQYLFQMYLFCFNIIVY